MILARLALRRNRRALTGFALLALGMTTLEAGAYSRVAGTTTADRLNFARQEGLLAQQFTWLYPAPVRIDTVSGYLQWHVFSVMTVILCLWAVFLGAGSVRGAEERGLVDMWLAAGVRRTGALLVPAAVGLAGLAGTAAAAALGVLAGAALSGETVPAGGLLAVSTGMWAATASCFCLALVASQVLSRRRTAIAATACAVVALFLINGFARQVEGLRPVSLLSPFHWYDGTSALAPGSSFSGGALAILVGAGAVMLALAAALMGRRDLDTGILRRRPRERPRQTVPSTNRLLRRPVAASLHRERWSLLAWSAGTATGAVFLVAASRPAGQILESTPQLRAYLHSIPGGAGAVEAYIAFAWFGLAALLAAAFAITAASRWSADDLEGRLAEELSAPVSRARVAIERLATLLAGLALLSAVNVIAVLAAAAWLGVSLTSPARVVLAGALLIPVGMVFGAAGSVLAAVRPRLTVMILTTIAITSYLLFALGPLLKLPGWALDLSAFQLYGTPMVSGLFGAGLAWLLAAAAVTAAGGLLVIEQREIGS